MIKLMVGVDGSAGSTKAVYLACRVAKLTNAHISFIHVVALPSKKLTNDETELVKKKLTETILKPIESIAKETGAKFTSEILLSDDVIDCLINESKKGYDVAIVGRRGLTGIEKLVLGSVSQSLVEKAECNVLVAK